MSYGVPTTELVRVAVLAFLGATTTTVSMKSIKQVLIEALVAAEVQLCPLYILRCLYESITRKKNFSMLLFSMQYTNFSMLRILIYFSIPRYRDTKIFRDTNFN